MLFNFDAFRRPLALHVGGDSTVAGGWTAMRLARWGCPVAYLLMGDFDVGVDLADFLIFQQGFTGGGQEGGIGPTRSAPAAWS